MWHRSYRVIVNMKNRLILSLLVVILLLSCDSPTVSNSDSGNSSSNLKGRVSGIWIKSKRVEQAHEDGEISESVRVFDYESNNYQTAYFMIFSDDTLNIQYRESAFGLTHIHSNDVEYRFAGDSLYVKQASGNLFLGEISITGDTFSLSKKRVGGEETMVDIETYIRYKKSFPPVSWQ